MLILISIFRVRDEYHQFYIDYIDRKYPDSDADSDVESDAESDAESGVESDDSREILLNNIELGSI